MQCDPTERPQSRVCGRLQYAPLIKRCYRIYGTSFGALSAARRDAREPMQMAMLRRPRRLLE